MKRFAIVICAVLLLCPSAYSSAIYWSEVTVFLDTISFTTSGDLSVDFTNGSPHGTLVSRDEVWYDDIIENNRIIPTQDGNIECNYSAGDSEYYTTVSKTWALTSTGSGYLDFSVNYTWDYDALDGYAPDYDLAGPDDFVIIASISGEHAGGYQLDVSPPLSVINAQTYGPTVFFDENEISELTITAYTCADGFWVDMPSAQPVPEPSVLILMSFGLFVISIKLLVTKGVGHIIS